MGMVEDNKPKQICIHKSGWKDWKTQEDWDGVEDIKAYHLTRKDEDDNSWNDIGYHYVIKKSGEVQTGRDLKFRPASCTGHNRDVAAICLIGEFTKEEPTSSQMESLKYLCLEICKQHLIPNGVKLKDCTDMHRIFTHSDYRDKPGNRYCPGKYLHNKIGCMGKWVRDALKDGK